MDNPETLEKLEQLKQLDESSLTNLFAGSGGSLIPESLVNLLTFSFVLLNVLGITITILYLIGVIRRWRVQSAVLHMQKDLAEIKQTLAGKQSVPESAQVVAKD